MRAFELKGELKPPPLPPKNNDKGEKLLLRQNKNTLPLILPHPHPLSNCPACLSYQYKFIVLVLSFTCFKPSNKGNSRVRWSEHTYMNVIQHGNWTSFPQIIFECITVRLSHIVGAHSCSVANFSNMTFSFLVLAAILYSLRYS